MFCIEVKFLSYNNQSDLVSQMILYFFPNILYLLEMVLCFFPLYHLPASLLCSNQTSLIYRPPEDGAYLKEMRHFPFVFIARCKGCVLITY
jgi:hypothetical protein